MINTNTELQNKIISAGFGNLTQSANGYMQWDALPQILLSTTYDVFNEKNIIPVAIDLNAYVTMRFDDWVKIVKDARYPQKVKPFCPACRTNSHIRYNGKTYKGHQKFLCVNPFCTMKTFLIPHEESATLDHTDI